MTEERIRIIGVSQKDCDRQLEEMMKNGKQYILTSKGVYKRQGFLSIFRKDEYFIVVKEK